MNGGISAASGRPDTAYRAPVSQADRRGLLPTDSSIEIQVSKPAFCRYVPAFVEELLLLAPPRPPHRGCELAVPAVIGDDEVLMPVAPQSPGPVLECPGHLYLPPRAHAVHSAYKFELMKLDVHGSSRRFPNVMLRNLGSTGPVSHTPLRDRWNSRPSATIAAASTSSTAGEPCQSPPIPTIRPSLKLATAMCPNS